MSEHPLWVPCRAGETLEEAGKGGGVAVRPPSLTEREWGLREVGRPSVCIKQVLLLTHLPGCLAVEKAQKA